MSETGCQVSPGGFFSILRLQPNPGGFGGGRSDSTQDLIDLSRVEQFSTNALTGVCAV